MEITEEQIKKYINKNWNNCFVLGMAKFVRDAMFSKQTDEDMEDYRQELKDLIFEAISDGVKTYLEQHDAEAMGIIGSSLSNALENKKITVRFD